MNLNINKYLFSFIVTGLIFTLTPTITFAEGVKNINNLFVVSQQKSIINYENSPSCAWLQNRGLWTGPCWRDDGTRRG